MYIITFQQTRFDTFLHISGSFASAHLVFFFLCLVVWASISNLIFKTKKPKKTLTKNRTNDA